MKDDGLANPTVLHKYVPFIELMLFDTDLPDEKILENLKKYFIEIDKIDVDILKYSILFVKDTHRITEGALIEFEDWVNENYN